ncbi:hypothetical protein [Streptomyces niveus]
MILALLPEVGVGTIRLGMSAREAVGVARELGFASYSPDSASRTRM